MQSRRSPALYKSRELPDWGSAVSHARVRVVTEPVIFSKPSQSPPVPCIGRRYLSVESSPSKSFAFQTYRSPGLWLRQRCRVPDPSLTCARAVPWTLSIAAGVLWSLLQVAQSLRSIGALVFEVFPVKVMRVSLLTQSPGASQCLTVSLAVGGASQPSPRPSTEPHQPPREHALTQP